MRRIPELLRRLERMFSGLGLGGQLAIFLTLAIAPIGAIAIAQAMYAGRENAQLAVKALIDQTRIAADEEREAITTAFGVAAGLAAVLPLEPADARVCSAHLASLVERDPRYVFAGVLTPEGQLHCASLPLEGPLNYSNEAEFLKLRQDDRRRALVLPTALATRLPVVSVNHPVFREGQLVAFIKLSLPISLLSTIAKASNEDADFHVGLLDDSGEVFVQDAADTTSADWGPAAITSPLNAEDAFATRTFQSRSIAGEMRTYAITPVFETDVYALGSWRSVDIQKEVAERALLAMLFPAAMLAIALGVSYFAVHRLALRHVFYLARIMRAFEGGRRSVRASRLRDAPAELAALGQAFDRMADTIERDEAELAHAVEEKTTLLKEVYHRVKNNLQLVISIMNMQIRAAKTPGEKEIIARLQDRVMGLASIHQRLYQASDLTAVRCDELLTEVAENLVNSAAAAQGVIRLSIDAEPIVLGPDKAIPLALFATEIITNALKHGASPAEGGWLALALRRGSGRTLTLTIANSISAGLRDPDALDSSIGGQLVSAFTGQLNGEMSVDDAAGEYRVTLRFESGAGAAEDPPDARAAQ